MNCCSSTVQETYGINKVCTTCRNKAKSVGLTTLKSMLTPSALATLNAEEKHYFCGTTDCEVVYFDSQNKKYRFEDIKEVIYQKDDSLSAPICYCFGWTREKIKLAIANGNIPSPLEHIRENIKENRCGCEFNNPQGSCCLGNVTKYIKQNIN